MPLPLPQDNENRQDFIAKCMANEIMNKEFSDSKQRYAVCMSQWKSSKANIMEIDFTDQIKQSKK